MSHLPRLTLLLAALMLASCGGKSTPAATTPVPTEAAPTVAAPTADDPAPTAIAAKCAQVATHLVGILSASPETADQFNALGPDEKAAAEQEIADQCSAEGPAVEMLDCLLGAQTLPQMAECEAKHAKQPAAPTPAAN